MPDKPGIHGRDHRAGGADPIPGLTDTTGIQFDVNNVGNWLDINTTSNVAGVGMQFTLDGSSQFKVDSEGGIALNSTDSAGVFMSGPSFTWSDGPLGASNFSVSATGNVILGGASSSATIYGAGGIALTSNAGAVQFYGTNSVTIVGFTPSSGGSPVEIFRVTQDPGGISAPTYHIRSGASWVADL